MKYMLVRYQHVHRCVLSDTCLDLPLPCFSHRGLPLAGWISQAPVPLASVWVWLQRVTGWGHKREGSKRKPLFPAEPPAVSCLLAPSLTRKVPRVLASLGSSSRSPSSRAPGSPALRSLLCLSVVASCSRQFLSSTLPCRASQLFHPPCNHFPEFIPFFEICKQSASWLDIDWIVF